MGFMLAAVLILGATGLAVVFVLVKAAWERSRERKRRGPSGHIG
jgi:hypothetical protein